MKLTPSQHELFVLSSMQLEISDDELHHEIDTEMGLKTRIEMTQNPLIATGSAVASSDLSSAVASSDLSLDEELDIEKRAKRRIIDKPLNPLVETDSVISVVSFASEYENEPYKSRPRLAKGETDRLTVKMHRELSKKFTSNLSKDHSCKRSAKDVVRLNHIHKEIFVTNCAWVFGAIALMVVFGVGGWSFPDGSNPTCDTSNPDKNRTVCGMTEVIQSGASNLEFLSGFIIAGFVSSAVKLWTTRRTAYCGEQKRHIVIVHIHNPSKRLLNFRIALCGATRNLLINVASLVPQEERTLLARWSVLGFELSVLKSRCLIDTEQGRKYLELSNLIFGNEWDKMVEGDRHTSVWYWIQEKATELSERGIIDMYRLQTICNAVTLSRDKANDLMSPIDRDQPPPYVFVCAVLINVNLLLYSMAKGMVWSTWMNDVGAIVFIEPRLYCDIIILYAYTLIFSQLFDVCASMYNPFGPRDIDIPVSELC